MSKQKSDIHTYGEFYNLIETNQKLKKELNNLNNYTNLSLLALERFTWINLPNSLTSEIMEREIQSGMAFFTYTENYGFICLKCIPTKWNIYNEPIEVKCIGRNFQESFSVEDGVLIKDNAFNMSSELIVNKYTRLLNLFDISIETNIMQQQFPVIFPTTSDSKLTNEIVLDKYNSYMPFLLMDKKHVEFFKDPINLKIDYLADKMCDTKQKIYKEGLTLLGIGNANTEKKERMIEKEVQSNEDEVGMQLEIYYKSRRVAEQKIIEKYPQLNQIKCLITKDIIRGLERG